MTFLILDHSPTRFSIGLKRMAEHRGLKALFLTAQELVWDMGVDFFLADHDIDLNLRYRDMEIRMQDISGVYCGIECFHAGLWAQCGSEDADYASQETQALWLSILTSMSCGIVNPPALDALAGTCLSSPELIYLASRTGFQVPMVIDLESGKAAAELLRYGVPAHHTDLGCLLASETVPARDDRAGLYRNEHHCRIFEKVTGRPIFVTLVGRRFFVSTLTKDGAAAPEAIGVVPPTIRTRLRTLHKRLNLKVAEYLFRVMADGTWVFTSCARPPRYAGVAYGDELFGQVVDNTVGKGGGV